jgi:hypothetical protein
MKITVMSVVLLILIVWICLPVWVPFPKDSVNRLLTRSHLRYWGSLWKAPELTGNLRAWVINRDDGIIGSTVTGALINSTTSGNAHLGWEQLDPTAFATDGDVADAIVDEQAWIAVVSK